MSQILVYAAPRAKGPLERHTMTPAISDCPPNEAKTDMRPRCGFIQEGSNIEKLTRDGVALAYKQAGTGDPPMMLVHGWTCDHTFLGPQFEHFTRTRRVIAVDLRGHGESDKPRQAYTVAGFAHDLVWLCRQLAVEKPVVVGHSMGGNVALELAAHHPDFAAAIVMIDSCIVPSPALLENLKGAAETLRGSDYRETARQIMESICLPTDD